MEKYRVFKRKINYYETDQMQVVHHSNYIRFLEECRMDFMEQIGIDYARLEELGIIIPVMSVECNYKKPVRFGDTICIVPKVERFHGIKFDVSYRIYSEDFSVLHNEAKTSHCFVDVDFKPVFLKKDHKQVFDTMSALVQKDLLEME